MAIIELKKATKIIQQRLVIAPINLRVRAGEFVTLIGPAAAGKTTLLAMMGGLLTPTTGSAMLNGYDLADVLEEQRQKMRLSQCGYVLGHNDLVPFLTVDEQFSLIEQPNLAGNKLEEMHLLNEFAVLDVRQQLVQNLTPQKQLRVAMARAFYNHPTVIFVDDLSRQESADDWLQPLNTLRYLAQRHNVAVVMATRSENLNYIGDTRYHLAAGHLE